MRNSPLTCAAVVLFLTTAAVSPALAVNLDQQIKAYYGFTRPASIKESDKTVGTTATQLFSNNRSRFEDIISVTGANSCALGRLPSVTITTGVLLVASGGKYSENWVDDLYLPEFEMWAICSGAGTTIHIVEQFFQ